MQAIFAFLKPYLIPLIAEVLLELYRKASEDPEFAEKVDLVRGRYREAQAKGDSDARKESLLDFQRLISGRNKPE